MTARQAKLLALGAALAAFGCGGAAPSVDVTGTWAYDWQDRADAHLHGTMTVTQDAQGFVVGSLGWPTDYPDPTVEPEWSWTVTGVVYGDHAELYAVGNPARFDDPWWFEVAIAAGGMSGPEYAGNRVPMYTFRAVRSE